ncbi:MAG: hypothetical protein GC151_04995 [Betaproteobacteria bacterium]|nr:hypothetical protein [Betaproteobacteria bacterium]
MHAVTDHPGTAVGCREPLSEYLDRRDCVSSSMLRRFARSGSLAHARSAPTVAREATLGDALHARLLEPERFDHDYFELRGQSCPGPAESLQDRVWLPASASAALDRMCRSVREYSLQPVQRWLEEGEKELSIYWSDDSGHRFKGRPDCFSTDIVLELKTASDIRPNPFAKSRRRFGYDLQAAHYLEGVQRLTGCSPRFAYLVVESVSPHTTWLYELRREEIDRARNDLAALRARFFQQEALSMETV